MNWVDGLLLAFGLGLLVWACFRPVTATRKDLEDSALRRGDYPWYGVLIFVWLLAHAGFTLHGAVEKGSISTWGFFGYALAVAGLGVHTGRLIERGVREGRKAPEEKGRTVSSPDSVTPSD